MEIDEAMAILKRHQDWRMGHNVLMVPAADLNKAMFTIIDWWENTKDDFK
jgi:hypothetical protein